MFVVIIAVIILFSVPVAMKLISTEPEFYPDRALGYARWLLSQDAASLDESDRRHVDFLRGDGKEMLQILENGDREMKAGRYGVVKRAYHSYLMTAHAVSLRFFGQMLPQRLLVTLWYASLCVMTLGGVAVVRWFVSVRG